MSSLFFGSIKHNWHMFFTLQLQNAQKNLPPTFSEVGKLSSADENRIGLRKAQKAEALFDAMQFAFEKKKNMSNEKNLVDIPLNPGWLIGNLIMAYEIIPI